MEWIKRGCLYFASEMKAITDQCKSFFNISSWTLLYRKTGFVKYYKPEWEAIFMKKAVEKLDLQALNASLTIQAVEKRLMCDVPFEFYFLVD